MRAWASALDVAANFWPKDAGPVTLREFHVVVCEELETAGMQIPDERQNVVHVMSAFEARQWEVRALFVCGLTARDYPRHKPQNLLFPDADMEKLRASGIRLRTSAEEDRDEESLFTALKTRATESLVLTVSARDAGGQTILPSRHFTETEAREPYRVCRPAPMHSAAVAGTDGVVVGEALLAGLAEQHRMVSLTALEDLAKCRFRFFAGRSLGLKGVPDRPSERLQARVTGLIFHEAMEDWLTDKTRNFVELFERAFDEACRKRHIPPGYRVEVERIQLRRIARDVNESAQWPVEFSEAEVDCSLDFPGGVTVNCRVDRIDHVGNGDCVIVDYKSGKTANVDKLVKSETSLQGPLYALAVREKKHLNPVAMVFLAIREGKPIGWGAIPESGLELAPMPPGWIDEARERTVARLQSYLAGDIHVEPTTRDDCKWCDFAHACRIEQRADAEVLETGADHAG
jgi:ATP-dependent helicase/DNAse subunit B